MQLVSKTTKISEDCKLNGSGVYDEMRRKCNPMTISVYKMVRHTLKMRSKILKMRMTILWKLGLIGHNLLLLLRLEEPVKFTKTTLLASIL